MISITSLGPTDCLRPYAGRHSFDGEEDGNASGEAAVGLVVSGADPAELFDPLAPLAGHEVAKRGRRRIERHFAEARPAGRQDARQAWTSGLSRWSARRRSWRSRRHSWLEKGTNLLLFGPARHRKESFTGRLRNRTGKAVPVWVPGRAGARPPSHSSSQLPAALPSSPTYRSTPP
jgi:hypothetical protein